MWQPCRIITQTGEYACLKPVELHRWSSKMLGTSKTHDSLCCHHTSSLVREASSFWAPLFGFPGWGLQNHEPFRLRPSNPAWVSEKSRGLRPWESYRSPTICKHFNYALLTPKPKILCNLHWIPYGETVNTMRYAWTACAKALKLFWISCTVLYYLQ